MKSKVQKAAVLTLFVFALCLSAATTVHAQNTCSLATVAGDWAATLTGTILFPAPTGPVPGAAVVRFDADMSGNATGTEARNVGGQFVNETIKGSWTVKANCTGTLVAKIYQAGVLTRISVLSIVFDDLSTQVRMVQQSLTLPDGTNIPVVITLEGKKLSGD